MNKIKKLTLQRETLLISQKSVELPYNLSNNVVNKLPVSLPIRRWAKALDCLNIKRINILNSSSIEILIVKITVMMFEHCDLELVHNNKKHFVLLQIWLIFCCQPVIR